MEGISECGGFMLGYRLGVQLTVAAMGEEG